MGGTSGTLSGNITNDGTLIFNRSNDSSYSGIISGTSTGTVQKTGAGKLTLSGDSSAFAGNTTVAGGNLSLATTTAKLGTSASTVTVNTGATISGKGTVGNLTINSGGFVAPGINTGTDLMGTLTVQGSYTQTGTYTCNVEGVTGTPTAGTNNDSIAVTGTATLGGTLNIVPSGLFQNGQSITYTVLTSSSGLSGDFSSVTGTSPLFSYEASKSGNNAQLVLTKIYHIATVVTQGNLGVVASYIDTYAPPELEKKFNPLTTDELKQALSDFSPSEETQTSDSVATTQSAFMSSPFTWAGMDRLSKQSGIVMAGLVHQVNALKQNFVQLFGRKSQHRTSMQLITQAEDPKHIPISARISTNKTNLWIQGAIGRLNQESTVDPSSLVIQGLDGNTYDTSIGMDYALSNTLKLGITTGYTANYYKMKADKTRGSVNSARFGVYGLWEPAPSWYVNGAMYYGHHRFKADRAMTFIPAIAHQEHTGDHISAVTEIGKDLTIAKSLTLTPYVGVGALFLYENGYTERGAGLQNLKVKDHHSTTIQGKGGVQLASLWNWHDGTPVYSFARLGLTYRRAVGAYHKISAHLVNQGGSFTVRTRNRSRVLANPSVGFTANLSKDLSATLAYEGELGSNQRNNQALVRVNWSF
jgi:autotransporter-associated beta strand protein